MRISKQKLLSELESVQAGINLKETVHQSSCFVFQDGKLMTFNEEVAVIRPTCLDMSGAVKAPTLLSFLQKIGDDDITLVPDHKKGQLILKMHNGEKAGIPMESEIELPINMVEPREGKWKRLPSGFIEGLELANQCCSNKEEMFVLQCVHIDPNFIEGCDEEQLCRSELETGISESTLIRHQSAKAVCGLGMIKMMETDSWLHFKNQDGVILSCMRYMEKYPNFDHALQHEGTKVILPKGLKDATDRAEIFTRENPENQKVHITLTPGKIRVKGTGDLGWYFKPRKIKYKGEKLKFYIAPKLLIQLVENHNEARITKKFLSIDGSTYKYVTVLDDHHSKEDNDASQQKDGESSED